MKKAAQIVQRDTSFDAQVKQILVENGLDFKIVKVPLVGAINEDIAFGHMLADKSLATPYYGLYNSSNGACINTTKEGYGVSQNDEVVELVLRGMEKFGSQLSVAKAGALNDGRKVFVQLAIEGDSKVGKDIVRRYVTVIDSNDGSTGLSVGIGDLTMSCTNQFFKFYKKGNAKYRHTATIQEKMKEIPYLIELALNESMAQIKVYRKFQSTKVSQELAHELVHEILGYDRMFTPLEKQAMMSQKSVKHMDKLYQFIDLETADKGMNLWGLHSGITRWTTHGRTIKERPNSLEESLMTGTSYAPAMDSFKWCVGKSGLLLKPKTEMMLENL